LTSSYNTALQGAHEAAREQHYPPSALYVVATPIGNLADITLRALHVLSLAERIACEDTRHTQALLRAYGIDKNPSQLIALHQHNELEASQVVVDCLRHGQRVAYVSDAGTPGISDPGARLVEAVRALGLHAIPLPGASSVTTLLSVAGVSEDGHAANGFVFAGFLPGKAGERKQAVQALALEQRAVVLLEAPHRIESLAQALAVLGLRLLTVGRELTKQFEEIATLPTEQFPSWLAQDANRLRGEFVLVVHPATKMVSDSAKDTRVLELLLTHLPVKTAVKLAADITGEPRNTLYELALSIKKSSP
jgi:16S rRNA (cytidine1402-2'-O)-methyltransferase